MKEIMCSALCIMLAACSTEKQHYTEKRCYQENCFVTESKVTADMQKIHSLLIDYYRIVATRDTEYRLKFAEVTCKLFGKNNKQLNKEIDKLKKIYYTEEKSKENQKLRKDLEKSLKGLKLDYKQVVLLAKEMESDMAKIWKSNQEKFAPYKSRALEIVKFIDKQKENEEDWSWSHYEDELNWETKSDVYHEMRRICKNNYNKFTSYNRVISALENFISEGILIDSFLAEHPSAISPKDESSSGAYYYESWLVSPTTKKGDIIFDAARKAVSNKSISKQELSDLVNITAFYMRNIAEGVVDIQHDVTDKIDFDSSMDSYRENNLENFYSLNRYEITNLVDKNPKFEDFKHEIDKLSTRLAYKTYYKVNVSRFLYKEWRDIYYAEMKELFVNAVTLADKLHEMIKDEVMSDSTSYKRRYEHKDNVKNISNIKEIAKIGVDKILSVADCYIDSQKEIKDSLYKSFLKTRQAYLKNLGR